MSNKPTPPARCQACKLSRRSLNGCYCPYVRRYVDYAKAAPCLTPHS